jgi:hypothetical protein
MLCMRYDGMPQMYDEGMSLQYMQLPNLLYYSILGAMPHGDSKIKTLILQHSILY